jgi:putative nucleotidyltransferase with HDIG domain
MALTSIRRQGPAVPGDDLPELGTRLRGFLAELDRREGYVAGHSLAVCRVALRIARRLELGEHDLSVLAYGALLHDIGKVFIDSRLLGKSSALSEAEAETIRLHPVLGEALLGSTIDERPVLEVVRSHHERWDGAGYPDGLDGDTIPLPARIVGAADAYIAMRETRAYRDALELDDAVAELERLAGAQFDGECVRALVDSLG